MQCVGSRSVCGGAKVLYSPADQERLQQDFKNLEARLEKKLDTLLAEKLAAWLKEHMPDLTSQIQNFEQKLLQSLSQQRTFEMKALEDIDRKMQEMEGVIQTRSEQAISEAIAKTNSRNFADETPRQQSLQQDNHDMRGSGGYTQINIGGAEQGGSVTIDMSKLSGLTGNAQNEDVTDRLAMLEKFMNTMQTPENIPSTPKQEGRNSRRVGKPQSMISIEPPGEPPKMTVEQDPENGHADIVHEGSVSPEKMTAASLVNDEVKQSKGIVKNATAIHEHHHHIGRLQEGHDILRESVEEIKRNYEHMIEILKIPQVHDDLNLDALSKRHENPADNFDFKLEVTFDRAFERTMWDSLMFWGLPGVSRSHSFLITLGFLCTIFSQAMFCAAILKGGTASSAFLSDQYPGREDIEIWRLHSGHNIEFLDMLSGTTLVAKVCAQDNSVPFSGNFSQMRGDLTSYLSDNIGCMLCLAAIFVWGLTIIDSFNPVVSGICSVTLMKHGHSTTIGKATNPKYKYRIESFTKWRTVVMALMHLSRGAVVAITGVTGAMWLANTKNLANLILNASALSLILSIDKLAYNSFLPKLLQSLVEHAQPLHLPEHTFGGVVYTYATAAVAIGFALAFFVGDVLPDQNDLIKKEEMLCGGNTDFVYTRHHPTSTLYASEAHPAGARARKNFVDALKHLIDNTVSGEELTSNDAAITPTFGKVTLVHSENMHAYTKAYESYTPDCIDDTTGSSRMHTVQKNTQTGPDALCPDMKAFCQKPAHNLLRLMCPVTCGCADPRSGLMYRSVSQGCPIDTCASSPEYTSVVESLPCVDESQTYLAASAEWKAYFNGLKDYPWLSMTPTVQQTIDIMLSQGCNGILTAKNTLMHFDFCHGSEASATRPGIGSLRAFCPVTCQCKTFPSWSRHDCPKACFVNVTAWGDTA